MRVVSGRIESINVNWLIHVALRIIKIPRNDIARGNRNMFLRLENHVEVCQRPARLASMSMEYEVSKMRNITQITKCVLILDP